MHVSDGAAHTSDLSPESALPAAGRRIGLALSGGGLRAAVFHLGVLRRLAAERLLEDVTVVSTVSGGSLVTAAIVSQSDMNWPSSDDYLESIYPELRRRLTSVDLFSLKSIGWRGLIEFNLALFRSRAEVLATMLERVWGVSGRLGDLPDAPQWLINTTCIDTGKNWRFSKREMGDWTFGRHYAPEVPVAVAAAASAAVPYVVGAMSLPSTSRAGCPDRRRSTTASRATSRPNWRCGIRPTSRHRQKPSSTCSRAMVSRSPTPL